MKKDRRMYQIDWLRNIIILGIIMMSFGCKSDMDYLDIYKNEMIEVEGGKVKLGCTSDQGDDCDEDEPIREVTVKKYFIGRSEVTNKQYVDFLNDVKVIGTDDVVWIDLEGNSWKDETRIKKKGGDYEVVKGFENHPVNFVSWHGAVAFCEWLSRETGVKFRLPTEVEWEYAARGGSVSKSYKYSGSNMLDDVARYKKNADRSFKVNSLNANELGIYDMSGNLWEWVSDLYVDDRFVIIGDKDDRSNETTKYRVIRGGCFSSNQWNCRIANRMRDDPKLSYSILGFRIATDSIP